MGLKMPDKNDRFLYNPLTYKEQKAAKPKPEDIIPDCAWLDGDMKKNALGFVAWLRVNKMSPTWASTNSWKCSYKGKAICYIKLLCVDRNINNRYSWIIETYFSNGSKYRELLESEGLLKHISNNVWYCHGCHIKPGQQCNRKNVMILGKEVKGVCGNNYLTTFCDSDEAAVNGVKKIIDFRRQEIEANKGLPADKHYLRNPAAEEG